MNKTFNLGLKLFFAFQLIFAGYISGVNALEPTTPPPSSDTDPMDGCCVITTKSGGMCKWDEENKYEGICDLEEDYLAITTSYRCQNRTRVQCQKENRSPKEACENVSLDENICYVRTAKFQAAHVCSDDWPDYPSSVFTKPDPACVINPDIYPPDVKKFKVE